MEACPSSACSDNFLFTRIKAGASIIGLNGGTLLSAVVNRRFIRLVDDTYIRVRALDGMMDRMMVGLDLLILSTGGEAVIGVRASCYAARLNPWIPLAFLPLGSSG